MTKARKAERLSTSNLLFLVTATIFLAMCAVMLIAFPNEYMKAQSFLDLLNLNSPLIILSCGMSVVMIGGGIDISIGNLCGMIAVSCAVFLNTANGSVGSSVAMALGLGLAFGAMQGFLIAYLEIQPFIITLAGLFLANGILTTVSTEPINITNEGFTALFKSKITINWLGTYNRLGKFIPCTIKWGAVIAVVLIVLIALLMKFSRFGRNVYAVGGSRQSALMLGINVKRTQFITYCLSGFLAGIAGWVYILNTAAGNVGIGSGFEMKAIASSIIGGTLLTGGVGNLVGTPIGALILLLINDFIRLLGADSTLQSIVSGSMLGVFIIIQSIIVWVRGTSASVSDADLVQSLRRLIKPGDRL